MCSFKLVCCSLVFFGALFFVSATESSEENLTFVDILQKFVESNITEDEVLPGSKNVTKLRFELPCDTPNNDVGICMGIKNCKVLMKVLYKPGAKNFLIASKCGLSVDPSNPKICCGKWGHYINKAEKLSTSEKPETDITTTVRSSATAINSNLTDKFLEESERHGDEDAIDDSANPLPKHCGVQKTIVRGRIYGGTEAALGEFPWMAKLIHENSYGYRTYGCSGFLIAARYVMTAAHCLLSESIAIRGNITSVWLGEHNLKKDVDCSKQNTICAPPPVEIRVSHQIVHPEYRLDHESHPYDIGLIHLKKPVTFSDYIQPICLQTNKNYIVYNYYVSGWGKTEKNENSNVKMKLELPRYDHNSCKAKYKLMDLEITDYQICAGGQKGKDSCTGDSGGPLMMSPNGSVWFASGLVSYGLGCGREGWPGIYTNIPAYLPWIKREMVKFATLKKRKINIKN